MNKLVNAAVVAVSVVAMMFMIGSNALAGDRFNSDFYEAWSKTEDGVHVQCIAYKQNLSCNWDRFNDKIKAKTPVNEGVHN